MARAAPQLAVLSAIAHPEIETAVAARAALDELPEDDKKLYWDVILSACRRSSGGSWSQP